MSLIMSENMNTIIIQRGFSQCQARGMSISQIIFSFYLFESCFGKASSKMIAIVGGILSPPLNLTA